MDVDALLPSGSDPHTWEPAPQDVVRITEADMVFANGLDLEPSALNLIEANIGDAVLIELGEEAEAAGVAVRELDEEHAGEEAEEDEGGEGHQHSEGDPHLWMSIDNAREYVRIIRDALTAADPDGAATYDANYEAYLGDLDEVSSYLEQAAGSIPETRRKLITTHDAFGYLADYIGFEIRAFLVTGPGQEASPDDVEQIIRALEDEGVPAVFTEPQISSESGILDQAAEDAGAEVCTLYSDSLDDPVTSYIELVRFNAGELARCLGGADGG